MEEAEEAEEVAMRAAGHAAEQAAYMLHRDEDLVMTGLMSAATLESEGLAGTEGQVEAPEEDLEDSVMTATNTPTPADTIQPN